VDVADRAMQLRGHSTGELMTTTADHTDGFGGGFRGADGRGDPRPLVHGRGQLVTEREGLGFGGVPFGGGHGTLTPDPEIHTRALAIGRHRSPSLACSASS